MRILSIIKVIVVIMLLLIITTADTALASVGAGNSLLKPESSSQSVQAQDGSDEWMPIPPWLAGTWQTRFQTFLDSYDCISGQHLLSDPTTVPISRVRTIGTQQDAGGQIWHYAGTPYVRNTETEGYIESQTIVKVKLISASPERLVMRTTGRVCRWLRGTAQVYDSFYEVTEAAYSLLNEGVIKVEMEIEDFDREGKPLHISRTVCIERRTKSFLPIDRDERGNLRELFLKFIAGRAKPSNAQ